MVVTHLECRMLQWEGETGIRNRSRIFLGRIHKCNTELGLIRDRKGERWLRGPNGRLSFKGTMGLVQSSMRLVQSYPPQIWHAPDVSACKPNAGGRHATHLEGSQPVGKVRLIHGWPVKTHLNQEALKL